MTGYEIFFIVLVLALVVFGTGSLLRAAANRTQTEGEDVGLDILEDEREEDYT